MTRSRGSILVIEDDADIRSTLADLLGEEGYLTLTAPKPTPCAARSAH